MPEGTRLRPPLQSVTCLLVPPRVSSHSPFQMMPCARCISACGVWMPAQADALLPAHGWEDGSELAVLGGLCCLRLLPPRHGWAPPGPASGTVHHPPLPPPSGYLAATAFMVGDVQVGADVALSHAESDAA